MLIEFRKLWHSPWACGSTSDANGIPQWGCFREGNSITVYYLNWNEFLCVEFCRCLKNSRRFLFVGNCDFATKKKKKEKSKRRKKFQQNWSRSHLIPPPPPSVSLPAYNGDTISEWRFVPIWDRLLFFVWFKMVIFVVCVFSNCNLSKEWIHELSQSRPIQRLWRRAKLVIVPPLLWIFSLKTSQ